MLNIESTSRAFPEWAEESKPKWSRFEECAIAAGRPSSLRFASDWQERVLVLWAEFAETLTPVWKEAARVEALERELMLLKERCTRLERSSPVVVPIESLAPEAFHVIKPFHVVVRPQDDQYIASFFDANLSASGETRSEAISNLKDVVIATFDILSAVDESKLGPSPAQQKKVLGEFIRKMR